MFDEGSSLKRKQRGFSGKSKKKDKKAILAAARHDRLQREANRRQQKAAAIVQKVWRSRNVLWALKKRMRNDWDSKLADITKLSAFFHATGREFSPPSNVVVTLLRQFILFYDVAADRSR
jgi:hypothetical protein